MCPPLAKCSMDYLKFANGRLFDAVHQALTLCIVHAHCTVLIVRSKHAVYRYTLQGGSRRIHAQFFMRMQLYKSGTETRHIPLHPLHAGQASDYFWDSAAAFNLIFVNSSFPVMNFIVILSVLYI